MPIPDYDEDTGYLSRGTHTARIEEVRDRYATNLRRREIFQGLAIVVDHLRLCGVTEIWLDGSFVTDRPRPHDADVIYDARTSGVNHQELKQRRLCQADRQYNKKTYRVDLWSMPSPQSKGGRKMTIKEFFESDAGGAPKGIIKINTSRLVDEEASVDAQE